LSILVIKFSNILKIMSETTAPTSEEPKAKPAAKPKAEKPPAIEELPFDEFINKHYLQFTVYFSKADLNAQKAFSCADAGRSPSTIEPFLIDERKAPLDLLVFGVIQRLNAQKWLSAN